jgi:hypothetical protein
VAGLVVDLAKTKGAVARNDALRGLLLGWGRRGRRVRF